MASGTGSSARGQGSAGASADPLDSLANPRLAHLPASELMAHLRLRSESAFADVKQVLATRERRLADAEARLRAANAVVAGLRDEAEAQERGAREEEARIRRANEAEADLQKQKAALELSIANAGALALARLGRSESDICSRDRAADSGNGQSLAEGLEPGEMGARAPDRTASEIPAGVSHVDAGVKATPAKVGGDMPRATSPQRRTGTALPAPPVLPDEPIEERVVDVAVDGGLQEDASHQAVVPEAVASKRKKLVAGSEEKQRCSKKPKLQDGSWSKLHVLAGYYCDTLFPSSQGDAGTTLETRHALEPRSEDQTLLVVPAGESEPEHNITAPAASSSGHGQEGRNKGETSREVEVAPDDVVVDLSVDKGKGKAAEEGCPTGASGVSYDGTDSHSGSGAEEQRCIIEAKSSEMLDYLKAQVVAWESVYDNAEGGMVMVQQAAATTTTVDEAEAMETRDDAIVAKLQAELILCERRLEEAKNKAAKIEKDLRAEIMECKAKATRTESGLWAEIMARSNAVTNLEAWKHRAEEVEARIYVASMTQARQLDEIEAWKRRAAEAEMRLQEEINKRDYMAKEFGVELQTKLSAVVGANSAIVAGLRATIEAQYHIIKYLTRGEQSVNGQEPVKDQQQ